MLFPTIDFAVFFVVVFTANWLTMPRPRVWRLVMLAASYVFYGWWDWRFVPLLVASSVANQVFGVAISRARSDVRRRGLLFGSIAVNLGVLGVFKYYGFFASSVVNGLRRLGVEAGLPLVQFALPIGISFFTFHAVSYVVDIYRGETKPAHLFDFALYLAFFPHLVAGPIVRPRELIPQFRPPRDPRKIDAGRAFNLIILGLFKKIVIADLLARAIVDPVFAAPSQHSALDVLAAIYGFSVQIFCDFSAYTDIAIGVALLLGFRLPDNFNSPYAAVSIQDFWRRWHITLSRWLRDYLYIPLGGSRAGPRGTYRNLLLTMLLGGLWHGAAWRFVLWGGLHGAWLAGGRWRARRTHARRTAADRWDTASAWDERAEPGQVEDLAGPDQAWLRLRRRVVTFHLVTLAWIPFRADSLGRVWDVLGRLVGGWGTASTLSVGVVLAIAAGIGMQYIPEGWTGRMEEAFSRAGPLAQGAALAVALVVIDALGPEGVAAFIYFQF
jgi:D-alanyl-lipoteichoic acid acyltransferase DltB (MBOAT superfamily)